MAEYYNQSTAHGNGRTADGQDAMIVPLATAQMLGVAPVDGPEGKR